MTPGEFTKALEKLRIEPERAANLLGVHATTIWRWQGGHKPITESAARFLRYLVATKAKVDKVERILSL